MRGFIHTVIGMRTIFLADRKCALTVSGLYLGMVDTFERAAELDPAEKHFVELKPEGFHAVRFCFDDAFLLSPPEQISLYYTRTGVALFCGGFLREDASLNVLWQRRLRGGLFTLTRQQKVQLVCENEGGFAVVNLPDAFESCEISEAGELLLLEGEDCFALLTSSGEVKVLSEGRVLERGACVKAEIPFHDSMGHSAVAEWTEGVMTACSIRTAREPKPATYALALFESALIGADCTPFLSPALQEKAAALGEFLGQYTSAVLTEREDEVGLVYPRKKNVFDVRYFRTTIEDGRIANIEEVP